MALLLLAGCSPGDKFAPICPQLALVKDAADLTRFNGRGEDVSDLVVNARIVGVPAVCSAAGHDIVRADLTVAMELLRGPAQADRQASVGYFVAVTDSAEKLLDKQTYTMSGEFPPNVTRVTAVSDKITLDFPTSETVPAASYRIFVGLALTPQELAYNRRKAGTR